MIPLGNKLLVAFVASAFALGSVAAMADDQTSARPVDPAKLKAEKDTAKAAAAKMTPEEKRAARKAARAKALPEARPIGVPLDRRYREPLPPGGPAQRDPAKSNP